MIWLILCIGFAVLCLLVVMLNCSHEPISNYELDETTCFQMRQQGWSEEEIKEYMNDYGGYYVPAEEAEDDKHL